MSQFENIHSITVAGAAPVPVPANLTVEQVLSIMQIDVNAYEQNVVTNDAGQRVLRLSQSTGSKGAVEIEYYLEDGVLKPYRPNANGSFPTNAELAILFENFPEDDFSVTLTQPEDLVRYQAFLVEENERRVTEGFAKQVETVKELVDDLKAELNDFVTGYEAKLFDFEAYKKAAKTMLSALAEFKQNKTVLLLKTMSEAQAEAEREELAAATRQTRDSLVEQYGFETFKLKEDEETEENA